MTPSNDFSPIAEQGELELEAGLFSKLRRRREIAPVAPGFVRILLDSAGTPIEEVTAGQKYWSRARGWAKVDVRDHPLLYTIPFPDPSGLAGFDAVVDIAVKVCDPKEAVAHGAETVAELVRPVLQNAIRNAHGKSTGTDPEADPVAVLNALRLAAAENLESLVGPVPRMPSWLSAEVTAVSVQLDDNTEAHRDALMEKVRAVALADADGRSKEAKAVNQLRVHRIWEEGFANRLADPEKRALARIAADPSRENIDRVAGEFDQIEAQGRAAIVEVLREAVNKGYFAEDDAIYTTISALEKQYGQPRAEIDGVDPARLANPSEDTSQVVEAETVEAEAAEPEDGGKDAEPEGDDTDWGK